MVDTESMLISSAFFFLLLLRLLSCPASPASITPECVAGNSCLVAMVSPFHRRLSWPLLTERRWIRVTDGHMGLAHRGRGRKFSTPPATRTIAVCLESLGSRRSSGKRQYWEISWRIPDLDYWFIGIFIFIIMQSFWFKAVLICFLSNPLHWVLCYICIGLFLLIVVVKVCS